MESLRLRWEIGDRNGIAQCLEGLGAVAITQGRLEQGIRLCASAEGLRQVIGAQLNQVERPVYERIVATAHAQLDETTFTIAWAAGQAMPLDQWIIETLAT